MIYFEWIHRIISILTTLQQDHKSYSLLYSQKSHFVLVFIFSFSSILYFFFYSLPCIYSTMYKLHCVVSTFYSPSTPFHWLISFILGPKLSLGKSWSWKPCCSLEGILSIFCSLGPTLGCRWFHLWSLWRQALRWILVYLSYFHFKSLQVRYSSFWTLFHRGWWPNRSFEGLFECTLSFSFPNSLVSSRSRRYLCLQEWRSSLPVQGLVRWCRPFYSSISCWFTIDSLGSSR